MKQQKETMKQQDTDAENATKNPLIQQINITLILGRGFDRFYDSIRIHKLAIWFPIQFDSIQYWLFWIYMRYTSNFLKEKKDYLN